MTIAIIGAGIAGLYMGYKLNKQGKDFIIYDCDKEIGGRVKMFDFDGSSVVSGAGILTYCKDKIMLNLLDELGIEYKSYKSEIEYTFNNPSDLNKIFKIFEEQKYNFLKKRNKITFKVFGEEILGKENYKNFIKTFGYTDFEKADYLDTVDNYGFDEYLFGTENVYINWKKVLDALFVILKDKLILNRYIDKIEPLDDGKFKVSGKIFDKVIIATHIHAVRKLLPDANIYKEIESQPFARVYVKLDKNLSKHGFIVTDKPFQKIIEMNKNKKIYMISYCDNEIATKWREEKNVKDFIKTNLKKIFNEDYKVLKYNIQFWNYGTHFYKPLNEKYKNRNIFRKEAQHPYQNIYVIGEMVSNRQGNCEGAVRSVEEVLSMDCFKN